MPGAATLSWAPDAVQEQWAAGRCGRTQRSAQPRSCSSVSGRDTAPGSRLWRGRARHRAADGQDLGDGTLGGSSSRSARPRRRWCQAHLPARCRCCSSRLIGGRGRGRRPSRRADQRPRRGLPQQRQATGHAGIQRSAGRYEQAPSLLGACRAVMSAPLRAGASTTMVASARPLTIRFRRGNVPLEGRARGQLRDDRALPGSCAPGAVLAGPGRRGRRRPRPRSCRRRRWRPGARCRRCRGRGRKPPAAQPPPAVADAHHQVASDDGGSRVRHRHHPRLFVSTAASPRPYPHRWQLLDDAVARGSHRRAGSVASRPAPACVAGCG